MAFGSSSSRLHKQFDYYSWVLDKIHNFLKLDPV